ncbi:DUF6089 family protein [Flavobacterium sp.]|uniref:type IX secretion system protein PorG n=1 Tax=Flavobacterium sp. TaxID=239 RepID=UPI0008B8772D|nr:DUF6089 family protein [Flavobacterium sp.]OGS65281.1 MAG: hypothetical protein A2X21_05375 [Flavobacteria bacterium GWA2_35_26]HCF03839.1 hypothetical protein [Flavobacterium sp.]
MNKFFFALLSCCCFTATQAQINELGVFVGGSNFIGDVGATTFINPNASTVGLIYKWNKTPRHSWRITYIQSNLESNDIDSEELRRINRGFSFQNTIKEISGGIEFNFFDFNIYNPLERKITPYVFTGLSLSFYDSLFYKYGLAEFDSKQKTLALPIILGVKSNLTSNFVLGLEIGARYTFADDIDGSLPRNDSWQPIQFGNQNNNDWYVFSGITLTYTFGNKPCFCAE